MVEKLEFSDSQETIHKTFTLQAKKKTPVTKAGTHQTTLTRPQEDRGDLQDTSAVYNVLHLDQEHT